MSIHYGDEILGTSDVADCYNVNQRTVIGWIEDNLLPARKVGRDYVIFGQDLKGFAPPLRGRPRNASALLNSTCSRFDVREDCP